MPDRRPGRRPGFSGLCSGEVVKLTRQRSLWAVLGAGVVLLALVVLADATADTIRQNLTRSPLAWARNQMDLFGLLGQIGTGIVVLIASSRLYGMEYSSGTIRVLLSRGAGRLQLALAKFAVLFGFGMAVIAVYFLVAAGVCLALSRAQAGSLAPIRQLPASFWWDLARWGGVQLLSVLMAVLIGWTAAAAGRSLAFAMGAAMAVYPASNFLGVLMVLGRNATRRDQPWRSLSDVLLGSDMNYLLRATEPEHWSTAGFATPMDRMGAAPTLLAIAVYAVVFIAVASYRTVRPDVLE